MTRFQKQENWPPPRRSGFPTKVVNWKTKLALSNFKGRYILTWFASAAGDSGVLPSNLLLLTASFVSLDRCLSRWFEYEGDVPLPNMQHYFEMTSPFSWPLNSHKKNFKPANLYTHITRTKKGGGGSLSNFFSIFPFQIADVECCC